MSEEQKEAPAVDTESNPSEEANQEHQEGELEVHQEDAPEEGPSTSSEDVLELSWEETKDIAQARTMLVQAESQLSRLMIQYEKQKAALLARVSNLETFVFKSASDLKDAKNVNPDLTYELKLPQKEGEKGYFIRKEQ